MNRFHRTHYEEVDLLKENRCILDVVRCNSTGELRHSLEKFIEVRQRAYTCLMEEANTCAPTMTFWYAIHELWYLINVKAAFPPIHYYIVVNRKRKKFEEKFAYDK